MTYSGDFKSRDFNPLPRKEGDAAQNSGLHTGAYFNPLPRKEGDQVFTTA